MKKLDVYFACAMSSAKRDEDFRERMAGMIDFIESFGHNVLNSFIVADDLMTVDRPYKIDNTSQQTREESISRGNEGLLRRADVLVACVTKPSTGVGKEIGIFTTYKKCYGAKPNIICIHDGRIHKSSPCPMVTGDQSITNRKYYNSREAFVTVRNYLYEVSEDKREHETRSSLNIPYKVPLF